MGDEDGAWKGASWKQEADYSKETTELLEKVNATEIPVLMRGTGRPLSSFIDDLLAFEKKARLGGDTISTQKIAVEIVRIFRTLGLYDDMMANLELLVKRRGQMKQVQSAAVAEAALILSDPALSRDVIVSALVKLRAITEGKLHIELEHARFTVQLTKIYESEGNKRDACDILAAVQVETVTNMPRLEKLQVLLQQIRLCLELQDNTRAAIMSRKVNHRALGKDDVKVLKVQYFKLLIEYYERQEQYLLMARCWHEIYRTVAEDSEKLLAMSHVVALAALAPVQSKKEIEDASECCAFSPDSMQTDRSAWLKELLTKKIVSESLADQVPFLVTLVKEFVGGHMFHGSLDMAQLDAFVGLHPVFTVNSATRRSQLLHRVAEHDICVLAEHYTRIKISRLSALVGLSSEDTEKYIMQMVTLKVIHARFDRIAGVVTFESKKNAAEQLQQWDQGVNKVIGAIDHICHLIAKERMIQPPAAK